MPWLVEAWYKEPEEKNRSVMREAVARLGDGRLGPELTRLLADTKPGSREETELLDPSSTVAEGGMALAPLRMRFWGCFLKSVVPQNDFLY